MSGRHRPLDFLVAVVAAVNDVPQPVGAVCDVIPPDPAAGMVFRLGGRSLDPNPERVVAAGRSNDAAVDLIDSALTARV